MRGNMRRRMGRTLGPSFKRFLQLRHDTVVGLRQHQNIAHGGK